MNENIVARGKRVGKAVDVKKIAMVVAIIAVALLVIGLVSNIIDAAKAVAEHTHSSYCYKYSYRDDYYDDLYNDNLYDYKMDCSYTNAFGLGLKRYFNGGIVLPLVVLLCGGGYVLVQRKRSRGYDLAVTNEEIQVAYSDNKQVNIPLCSVYTVEKMSENGLRIVTSENAYVFTDMEGFAEVYAAITELMPTITIKGPANNEQVLAKGYPPALKPLLLVLLGLIVIAGFITAVACEMFEMILPFVPAFIIVLVLYLLAKTPYFVVTDKRVFYVSDFGRKLSLPLDKITVTVTHSWFRQLHIGAPTGRIHLFWVNNTAELYDTINALLNERQ